MSREIDVGQLEKKAYLSFHNDGIWDLFIGLSFVGMALGVIYNNTGITAIIPVLAIIIIPGLKKAVTQPRLGYVKFSTQRQEREKKSKQMLVYLMSLTAILGVVVAFGYAGDSTWQRWIKNLALIPFGLVLSSIALAVGLLYEIRRILVYAALILVTFVAGHLLELRPTFHFFVIGIPMTLVGLIMLVRFIGKNPKPAKEESSAI